MGCTSENRGSNQILQEYRHGDYQARNKIQFWRIGYTIIFLVNLSESFDLILLTLQHKHITRHEKGRYTRIQVGTSELIVLFVLSFLHHPHILHLPLPPTPFSPSLGSVFQCNII